MLTPETCWRRGAGPDDWAAMFKQQGRWARGSNEIMVVNAWKCLWRLPWRRKLHYLQLMLHYPTVALTWLLGVALTILYMTLGTTGIAVRINQWAAFYLDVFTMRLVLYLCLRRFNISPHEAPGSLRHVADLHVYTLHAVLFDGLREHFPAPDTPIRCHPSERGGSI